MAGYLNVNGFCAVYKNPDTATRIVIIEKYEPMNSLQYQSSAIGYDALYSNVTGTNGTALGFSALMLNTTENQNTAIGSYSLLRQNT